MGCRTLASLYPEDMATLAAPMNTANSDDEHEENSADDEYPLTEGEPLVCSSCGKQVAVIYRPQSEYPMRSSGFWHSGEVVSAEVVSDE